MQLISKKNKTELYFLSTTVAYFSFNNFQQKKLFTK